MEEQKTTTRSVQMISK